MRRTRAGTSDAACVLSLSKEFIKAASKPPSHLVVTCLPPAIASFFTRACYLVRFALRLPRVGKQKGGLVPSSSFRASTFSPPLPPTTTAYLDFALTILSQQLITSHPTTTMLAKSVLALVASAAAVMAQATIETSSAASVDATTTLSQAMPPAATQSFDPAPVNSSTRCKQHGHCCPENANKSQSTGAVASSTTALKSAVVLLRRTPVTLYENPATLQLS